MPASSRTPMFASRAAVQLELTIRPFQASEKRSKPSSPSISRHQECNDSLLEQLANFRHLCWSKRHTTKGHLLEDTSWHNRSRRGGAAARLKTNRKPACRELRRMTIAFGLACSSSYSHLDRFLSLATSHLTSSTPTGSTPNPRRPFFDWILFLPCYLTLHLVLLLLAFNT